MAINPSNAEAAGVTISFTSITLTAAEGFGTSLTSLDENPINNRIPLILIHGIFGEETQEYWQNFINYFNSDNSLTRKYKLYEFKYDSNQVDVYTIAQAFKNNIENLEEITGRKFVILAHSLGGLVARSYMQEHGGNDRVKKLITLATPHHGSPLANDAPRVGNLSNLLLEAALKLMDNNFWCRGDLLCISRDYIDLTEPNRKDMRWDSYNDPSGVTGYNTCPECNPWLQNLNSGSDGYNNKLILYYGYMTSVNSSLFDSLAAMGAIELATFLYENRDNMTIRLAGASVILYHVYLAGDGLVPYDSGAFHAGIGISDYQRRLFPGYDHDQMKDGVAENGTIPLFDSIKRDLNSIANIVKNDFNGDGISDILWRNDSNGQVVLWCMNTSGSMASSKTLYTSTGWTIVGTGDFNGDGISDILWRNDSNGQVVLWCMNTSGSMASSKTLYTSTNWKIVGTGDFNGDGISDILWRKDSNGQVVLWCMNTSGSMASSKTLYTSTNWNIVGTGDFNGDGISDILWRKASNGQVQLWCMNANAEAMINKTLYTSTNWKIVGTGDFNGDGISDILWRKDSIGQVQLWCMNTIAEAMINKTLYTSTRWKIVGTGDFNGDGISDILWRKDSNGQVQLWCMNTSAEPIINKTLYTSTNWNIVP